MSKCNRASVKLLENKELVALRGIPYIRANSRHDLYLAQGYITARDRLWQMDLLRRSARGELAEILGRPALEEDKRRRLFNFSALAEDMLERSSPELKDALEAYAEGVNAFIETRQFGTWPSEFTILHYTPRPWRPADSLVITKLYAETLSNSWRQDLERAALANLTADIRKEIMPETSPLDVFLTGNDQKASTKDKANRSQAVNRSAKAAPGLLPKADLFDDLTALEQTDRRTFERIGLYREGRAISNAWVVAGRLSPHYS